MMYSNRKNATPLIIALAAVLVIIAVAAVCIFTGGDTPAVTTAESGSDTTASKYFIDGSDDTKTPVQEDKKPTVIMTEGHGEGVSASLFSVIFGAGYEAKSLDISKNEIPDGTAAILINAPKTDFVAAENGNSESDKIEKYLAAGGMLIVFADENITALPNLSEYLEEWGISVRKFTDAEKAVVEKDGVINGIYMFTDEKAASLHEAVSGDKPLAAAFPSAVALEYPSSYRESKENGIGTGRYQYSSGTTSRSSAASVCTSVNEVTPINLITLSYESTGEDKDTFSYVLCVGSAGFTGSEYTGDGYANGAIIEAALKLANNKNKQS